MPTRYPRFNCTKHPGNRTWKGQCVECNAESVCPIHHTTDKYKRYCRECAKDHAKTWRHTNPVRLRELELRKRDRPEYVRHKHESTKLADQRVRDAIFERYGTACACCGIAERGFLTLDHVNGNGASERRMAAIDSGRDPRGFAGVGFYKWLRRQGFPDGYQALCWNCNAAKHRFGICPHKTTMPDIVAHASAAGI